MTVRRRMQYRASMSDLGDPARIGALLFVSEYGARYSVWALGDEARATAEHEAKGSTLVKGRAHARIVQRARHRALSSAGRTE